VHLSELGLPITNDPYYNPYWLARQLRSTSDAWGGESRMLLQAHHLQLPDPLQARTLINLELPWPSRHWPTSLQA
jgi:23S rRNA-/tRNA-specific pseudouridylate synthase